MRLGLKSCVFLLISLFAQAPLGATADQMQRIDSRDEFMRAVAGKSLTRFGIRLNVSDAGQITGRAFTKDVTGNWRWQNGYFCRDLYHGAEDLGPNCQVVEVSGNTIRFTADEGRGIYADFRLR